MHGGRGPRPLSSRVPIFGISGWAGLASPQIPQHISGVGKKGKWGGGGVAQRNRIVECGSMREVGGRRKRGLKNRFLCMKEGERKKEEKSGRQTPLSHQGPHSPCLVVSTPSTQSCWEGTTPSALLCLVLLLCLGFVLWMPTSSSRVAW